MRNFGIVLACAGSLTLLAVQASAQTASPTDQARQAQVERLPNADLGNGHFKNPILRGLGADNTVLKVGDDYYMAAGGGWPDQLIWHSRDLVNWRPLSRALTLADGDRAWASDLAYHDGKFYLYTTLVDTTKGNVGPLNTAQRSLLGTADAAQQDRAWDNIVLVADNPEGPWSEPIHLGVYGLFDPGHVVDQQGNRYLYFNAGYMVRLSPDGTETVGELKKVYDGWDYPADWVAECKCLEAPKFTYHNGWYYMLSAQGGTGGPATAHMAIVARSRSVEGPWENSPHNPLVHTGNSDFPWWREGHGTLVPDADGKWWVQYTGYEKDYEFWGKQVLMLPIEWTPDGWPRVPAEADATKIFEKPAGEDLGGGMPLSDNFAEDGIGIQWNWPSSGDAANYAQIGQGALRLKADGKLPGDAAVKPADANLLSVVPQNHSYFAQVEVEIPAGAEAGLLLDDGSSAASGWANVALRDDQVVATWNGVANYVPTEARRLFLRLRNIKGDVTAFYSADGENWTQFANATRVANGRRLALYSAGSGEAVFRNFIYRGLE